MDISILSFWRQKWPYLDKSMEVKSLDLCLLLWLILVRLYRGRSMDIYICNNNQWYAQAAKSVNTNGIYCWDRTQGLCGYFLGGVYISYVYCFYLDQTVQIHFMFMVIAKVMFHVNIIVAKEVLAVYSHFICFSTQTLLSFLVLFAYHIMDRSAWRGGWRWWQSVPLPCLISCICLTVWVGYWQLWDCVLDSDGLF